MQAAKTIHRPTVKEYAQLFMEGKISVKEVLTQFPLTQEDQVDIGSLLNEEISDDDTTANNTVHTGKR